MHKLWFKDSNVRLKITLQKEELLFKLYSHMHCSPGSGVKRSSPCQLPCTKSVQRQTENTEGKSYWNLQQMSGCCASCLLHALPSYLAPKLSWLFPEVRTHLMKIFCCGLHVQKGNSGQLRTYCLETAQLNNQDKNQENLSWLQITLNYLGIYSTHKSFSIMVCWGKLLDVTVL